MHFLHTSYAYFHRYQLRVTVRETLKIPVTLVARKVGEQWEGICLNFDIAVQGGSLSEVETLLKDSVIMYLQSFSNIEDHQEFLRAINRPVPLSVSAPVYLGVMLNAFMSLFRGSRIPKKTDKGLSYSQESLSHMVCPV